jgi:hypothetical protein
MYFTGFEFKYLSSVSCVKSSETLPNWFNSFQRRNWSLSWAKVSKWLPVDWSGIIWVGLHQLRSFVGADDVNWLSTFQLLHLSKQEVSAKQFLAVNLRGDFDMVASISAQGSHFETFAQLRLHQFLRVFLNIPQNLCAQKTVLNRVWKNCLKEFHTILSQVVRTVSWKRWESFLKRFWAAQDLLKYSISNKTVQKRFRTHFRK